jgi:imidazolonepropionase-like amidohydrolase
MASALARANVAVVIDPLIYGVRNFDSIHGSAQNVTRLAAAGVPVMLNTGDAHNIRVLRQVAGNAVRAGLDRRAAIKAITQTPADTFGMPNRGRLTKGAQANLVVWSGDPLELSSAPIAVLIGGQKIALESRQTRLRDRYLRGTGTGLPAALPLP